MMTTWLLPPRSGATFTTPRGNVIAATLGRPAPFEDSDVNAALAQGWTYSDLAPVEQLGKLTNLPATMALDNLGNLEGLLNPINGEILPIDDSTSQTRNNLINAWKQSPMIVAPLRQNTFAYTTPASNEVWGSSVRLANGVHLTANASGTTGASEPANYFDGRPITDGTVGWYQDEFTKTTSDLDAPIVTAQLFTNYAAEGLTLNNFVAASGLPLIANSNEAIIGSLGNAYLSLYSAAIGTSAFSANATGNVTGTNANGFPVSNTRSFAYSFDPYAEIQFIVSDHKFALAFHNFGARAYVTIDGKRVEGAPTNFTGASNNGLLFNFNGNLKDRLVTISANAQFRGVGLSAQGSVRAAPISDDVCLLLADSHGITTSPNVTGCGHLGFYLKRYLGFGGLINASNGSSGYINKGANQFNLLEMLNNVDNIAAWQYLNPKHIIIHHGNNDNPLTINAVIESLTKTRELFPFAKISVCTCFSGSTGPNATILNNAAIITSAFNQIADRNSRLITTVGTSAATSQIFGLGNASSAITVVGNSTIVTGVDNTHVSPGGSRYLARRIAEAINLAWAGNY